MVDIVLKIIRFIGTDFAFLGAILGAILGGLFTFLSVLVTIIAAKDDLINQITAQERNRDIQDRRALVIKTAELIGDYETFLAKYIYGSMRIRILENELESIYSDDPFGVIEINAKQTEINNIRYADGGIRVNANRSYFAVKMLLMGITEAEKLVRVIERIHKEEIKMVDSLNETIDAGQEAVARKDADVWNEEARKEIEKAFEEFRGEYQ